MLLSVSALPSQDNYIASEQWVPAVGDRLIIDTADNVGYLVHRIGGHTSFKLATGQLRNGCYIGLCYFFGTPNKRWTMESVHIKGDRVTYGKTGTFLRLYDEGEFTHYGIHGHRDSEIMLADDTRYKSNGCIIVSEEMLKVVMDTYLLNGKTLSVETMRQSPLIWTKKEIAQK